MLVTADRSDPTLLWDSRAGQDTSHVHPEWTISDRSSDAAPLQRHIDEYHSLQNCFHSLRIPDIS